MNRSGICWRILSIEHEELGNVRAINENFQSTYIIAQSMSIESFQSIEESQSSWNWLPREFRLQGTQRLLVSKTFARNYVNLTSCIQALQFVRKRLKLQSHHSMWLEACQHGTGTYVTCAHTVAVYAARNPRHASELSDMKVTNM